MKGYYCSCNYGKDEKGKSVLKPVEVTSEGICEHCGYYAVFKTDEAPKSLKRRQFFEDYEVHLEPREIKRS